MRMKVAPIILLALVVMVGCRTGADKTAGSGENEPLALSVAEAVTRADDPQISRVEIEPTPPDQAGSNVDQAAAAPADVTDGVSLEDVVIAGEDGLPISGTFYTNGARDTASAEAPQPGVILLHMNGRQRGDWDSFGRQLAQHGYAALAVDMRGHGETGGQRDWDKTTGDLIQVKQYLASRAGVDPSRLAIVGASIGANMALVAGDSMDDVTGVALLSPGRNYMGVTTEDRIEHYGQRPLFISASEEDSESAITAQSLNELAQGEVQLQLYSGAGHGTDMLVNRPDLGQLIIDWLDQIQEGTAAKAEDSSSGLPAPSLFETAWDDSAPFRQGLIRAESGILDQLKGAPIYHMDMAISPDLMSVAGRLELLYTNQEDIDLEELYFHLYPNLLEGRASVSALTVNDEPVQPEYLSDDTVLRVPMASSLAPGEKAVIALEFYVDIPSEGGSNYGVFATIDGVMALAHFFPQLSVYDDEGWNIEPPPANADVTYADASFYLVRVTAPAEQVLVASGVELDRQETDGTQVATFAAGPARDFYLVSNEDYIVTSKQVGETIINSYGFPDFIDQNELALTYASGALESFNERIGTYPYTEFDIVPTPNLALGVEYPGLVVIRTGLYDPLATLGPNPATFYQESTTVHEVGHQWFYNTIGNDQLDEPWLDESLTQYITFLYFVDTYGEENAQGFRDSFLGRWDRVDRLEIPIGLPADDYSDQEYGAIVYGRGPLFFEALSEEMGEETFDAFLRQYYQQNKWGIASGNDLKSLAEEKCQCDLTPLFARWVGDR